MIADPRFAPRRNDLPWLRRRRAPKAAPHQPAPTAAPHEPAPAAAPLKEFLAGHTTHHEQHEAPPAPASSSLDLDAPTSAPSTAQPTPASSSLDLDESPSAAPPAPTPSSSLDLDDRPQPARPAPRAESPQRRRRDDVRVRVGDRHQLSPSEPTVTLTRLQSGIGALTFEAAASDEVGDLRLGAAYELSSGLQMIMQMTQGNRFAPPHSKRPVLVGGRDRFERVSVDLRQCRDLCRLAIYAFSERRQPLTWGGTLIVTTYGGARIELPLDPLQGGDSAVLMSLYQVRGEFVLRAEMQAVFGDVRACARAYGYDRITWLDDRTPVE